SSSHAGGSTATTVAPSPAPYAQSGPYSVGFTTLHLAGGRRVVVWYPAAASSTAGHAQESIDVAGFLSPALQAKVPKDDRILYQANAYQDAPAASAPAGGFPLVVFSHGFAGFAEQSVTLTTHLAGWGFVVAAPEHVERSLDGLLGTAAQGVPKQTDRQVLSATATLLVKTSSAAGLLHGLVDANQIVAAGHSAGASAALDFASDPRVKAWISYSVSNAGGPNEPAAAIPDKPGMVMLGTTDGIIPPAQSRAVYVSMRAPKTLVEIAKAGHLVFSDICLIGASKGGIVAIAKAIKLPIPASLLRLGSDGCTKDHPPVAQAFPAIDQLSVAFFRNVLGIDPQPVGLSTDAVRGLGADVTVTRAP
ncbi:MAG TPA: alpha/beta hydrolase, partial [Acidimicrobiia bacterium]|nr:alpha/beta hydrolase [Acidimicrobiia bacterium]